MGKRGVRRIPITLTPLPSFGAGLTLGSDRVECSTEQHLGRLWWSFQAGEQCWKPSLFSFTCQIGIFPSCFSAWLCSGSEMKPAVAGEPSLPPSLISSAFFRSLQSGPNLLPAHLIPSLCCVCKHWLLACLSKFMSPWSGATFSMFGAACQPCCRLGQIRSVKPRVELQRAGGSNVAPCAFWVWVPGSF